MKRRLISASLAAKKQKKVFAICTLNLLDRFETGDGALEGVGVWIAEGQNIEGLAEEMDLLEKTESIFKADTIEELAA